MDTPDSSRGTPPPFDGLRAYLRAVQSRDDLLRIRRLEQRNGGLKRAVERLTAGRGCSSRCPKCGSNALKKYNACVFRVLIKRVKRFLV